jgi:hypothetical protein
MIMFVTYITVILSGARFVKKTVCYNRTPICVRSDVHISSSICINDHEQIETTLILIIKWMDL